MPKNTVAGPSDVLQDDVDHPAYMREHHEEGDGVSPGNSSSTSDEKQNGTDEKTESSDRAPVRTTENPSAQDRAESSGARSTTGATKGSKRQ